VNFRCVCSEDERNSYGEYAGLYEKTCKGCGGYTEKKQVNEDKSESVAESTFQALDECLLPKVGTKKNKYTIVYSAIRPTLGLALKASEVGDWDSEWQYLCQAADLSRSAVLMGPGKIYTFLQDCLIEDKLIFRDTTVLGSVVAETIEQWGNRTGQEGKMFVQGFPEVTKSTVILGNRILHGSEVFPIDESVEATIFVDGSDQFVTTKSGTIGLGLPIGGVGVGLGATKHKNKLQDSRVCSFVITSDSWQTKTNFAPSQLEIVRPIAEKFRRHLGKQLPRKEETDASDISAQLHSLANLLERGLIDEAEFKAAKGKILDN